MRDEHPGNRADIAYIVGAARPVAAVVVLVVVLMMALSVVGRYRDARSSEDVPDAAPSVESTQSAPATESVDSTAVSEPETSAEEPSDGQTVVVLVEGLNMRKGPGTDTVVIKRLPLDSRLTLLEEGEGWYRVRDSEGDEGWVAAGGQYTKTE